MNPYSELPPEDYPTYSLADFIDYLIYAAEDVHDLPAEHIRLSQPELGALSAAAIEQVARGDCRWCGVDTAATGEYYMLTDTIWDTYGPTHGCSCIGRIEHRMGRQLQPDDFTDVPLNTDDRFQRSDRLRDRLAGKTTPDAALSTLPANEPANDPDHPGRVKRSPPTQGTMAVPEPFRRSARFPGLPDAETPRTERTPANASKAAAKTP